MRATRRLTFVFSWLCLLSSGAVAQSITPIPEKEIEYQNEVFERWWGGELVWEFDQLPEKNSVSAHRVPYSGHDYPDAGGGTLRAMRRYDAAFHPQSGAASRHEQKDIEGDKERRMERRGIFGLRVREIDRTPAWYGHCNGWTAAAIRHAEPQNSVVRNGVRFTPADIKGLLAELYMYTPAELLGGQDEPINAGLLHVVISNWLGRGSHPVAMEAALGEEVWNYPLYAYATTNAEVSGRRVEVKMNVAYADSTRREFDQSPRIKQVRYFHYLLELDEAGRVVGGNFYADSGRVEMLWAPLAPIQAGTEGNKEGNPHLNVKEVLSIWRDSVPTELRQKWWNIDPPEEDQIAATVVEES